MRRYVAIFLILLAAINSIPMPCCAQSLPPRGLRQIQVSPRVFAAAEVLEPGMYNVWVRIGERAPAPEVSSGRVTVDWGGTWKKYSNVDFSRGGKPRHVTIFPDSLGDGTVNYIDFHNPGFGMPGPGEFILHIDNRSEKDTVTYVFQCLSGRSGSDHDPTEPQVPPRVKPGTSAFDGLWHTRRVHSGCCSHAADADLTISTNANGKTTTSAEVFPGSGLVRENTFTYSYGPGCTVSFTLSADGRSFTGTFSDNNNHRGKVQGTR